MVAYQYQQPELLQKLLSAVLSPAADPAAAADQAPAAAQCPCLAAVAAVLDAVIKAHEAPGTCELALAGRCRCCTRQWLCMCSCSAW